MICLPVMEPHQQPLATLQTTVTGKKILEIDQYRPGQPYWEYTICEFQEFSATQILHEINFGHSEAPKNSHCDHLSSSEF